MDKTQKPYKGEIVNVVKRVLTEDASFEEETFGPNLGYLFSCDFLNHPNFGFSRGGHTSLVVKYDEESGELETLNSRYKVIQNGAW